LNLTRQLWPLAILLFLYWGGGRGWNGWLKHVFRFGRISSWVPIGFSHARVGLAASLFGHRDCPKKNAARGRVRTGVGVRRNRRL